MGQRSQIIVKLPKIYYNENHPNNRPERLMAFHNQWLYGTSTIDYANKLVRFIDEIKKKEVRNALQFTARSCNEAINFTNYAEPPHAYRTYVYDDEFYQKEEYLNEILVEKGVIGFLDWFDNNNGYIYVDASGNTIKWGILNGREDANEIEHRTIEQFAELFEANLSEFAEDELILSQYEEVDALHELELFRKQLIKEKEDVVA